MLSPTRPASPPLPLIQRRQAALLRARSRAPCGVFGKRFLELLTFCVPLAFRIEHRHLKVAAGFLLLLGMFAVASDQLGLRSTQSSRIGKSACAGHATREHFEGRAVH